MGQFNLLKDAYCVKNTDLCRYDSLNGYITDFSINGDVNGWDIYSGICMYGVWNSVLFGTSVDKICSIGRSNPFNSVQAEKYYMLKINMKLTLPDNYGKKSIPTKGKVMWQTAADQTWTDAKSKEFDISITDQWYTYIINLGEARYWLGNVNNLRIYPFIDGFDDIKFMIKHITIDSIVDYVCLNTQCSYYSQFSHPCAGIGTRASVTSTIPKYIYTTFSGISETLILNIDGYGDEYINLGNNENLSGSEMAKILVDKISRVSFGAYAYVEVTYQEEAGTLSIFSGAMSEGAFMTIGGTAAVALGFANQDGTEAYSFEQGVASATGFDFGSSRRLRGFELNALVDSNTEKVAYYHNPNQYNVEAGRRDFADSMSSNDGPLSDKVDYYDFIDASQKLIIDNSHPINDSGRLSKIWVNGNYISEYDDESLFITPKIYILRPDKYNQVEIMHELEIPIEDAELRYTMNHVTFVVDCNVIVNKGDLIGFFNMKVLAPFSARNKAVNGVYFEIACGSSGPPSGKFNIGSPKSKGVIGISFYARSDRLQQEIQLDIDIGERINLNELSVYGKEYTSSFEYNVACCLDMGWRVELYNGTHWHFAQTCTTQTRTANVEHRNKAYGIECLSDCVTTVDGGQSGTYYIINTMGPEVPDLGMGTVRNTDPDFYSGVETYGEHSYFYVNGDAEWLNGGCCNVLANDGSCETKKIVQGEFKQPWTSNVYDFEFDPISFYLIFPNDKYIDIHRSVIYFKEPDNFKCYSLSYYLGSNGPQGDAEEVHFNYIPKFNSITMDGVTITSEAADGDPLTQVYSKTIFQNPVPLAIPSYQGGVCTNWEVYQTVMNLDFNVLSHDFDTISCRGFKVHTTWHKSTKIVEMELYSTIPVEPTLLDNIRMQSSVYGDYWSDVAFVGDVLDVERISAYISHNPRYFKLQLQSQDLFELKELTATLSEEHLKSLNCDNIILQDHAPKYQITSPKLLEIENTYDIPLNLSISIPRQLFKEEYVLSWIRFNSEDTTINGEVGPGALVRKSDDYPLYLKQGHISINTPTYYLKNLIDGKNAYVYENGHAWSFYKTLAHNEDVDYTSMTTSSVTSIGFLPVSSKFWKLCIHEALSIDILSLKLFFNSNSTIIPVVMSIEFEQYADGEHLDYNLWGRQDVSVNNSSLEMVFLGDGVAYYEVCSSFFIEGDFDIRIGATVHSYSGGGIKGPEVKFFSTTDPSTVISICWYNNFNSYSAYKLCTQYRGGVWVEQSISYASWAAGTSKNLKITREGDTFSLYHWSGSAFSLVFSYTFAAVGSKVVFAMCASNGNPYSVTSKISFDSLILYNGYAFLGDLDSTFLVINPVDIYRVYIQAKPDKLSAKYETTFNLITHTINPAVLLEDDFSNGIWYDTWVAYVGTSNSSFVEKDGAIYPFIAAGDFIYLENEFLPGAVSYDVEVKFNLEFPTTMQYFIELLTPDGTVSFKLGISGNGDNSASVRIESLLPHYIYAQQEAHDDLIPYSYMFGTITKNTVEYADGFKFTCSKSYKNFDNMALTSNSGSTVFYSGTALDAPFDRISKIRISYFNPSYGVYNQLRNYSTTYVKFRALPKLSDLESVVFEFADSQPVDALKIVQNTAGINYPSIWLSNNDVDDYYLWAKNFITTAVLSIPNESFFGDAFYQAAQKPYSCLLDDASYTLSTSDSEHFLVYDFGAGNSKDIASVYYKSYYYTSSYVTYGESNFKLCRIYGSNTFETYFVKIDTFFHKVRINLSDATLLHEFTINHNSTNTAYNDISITERGNYRYLIFHYPYSFYGTEAILFVDTIKLYSVYNQVTSSNIVLSNTNYTNYLAIDLGLPHKLDFVRNYGPKSALIDLYDPNNIDYSNTDTSDINTVEWVNNIPKLLFNFTAYADSVSTSRYIFTSGNLTLLTSDSPLIDQGHIGFSISDATGSTFSVEHTSDLVLGSNDFTIDFWFKRTRTGQEGIVGQISDHSSTSAFSFTFSIYNYLVFTAHHSAGFFELRALSGVTDTDWHHTAVCRYNNYISLYVDGQIQVSRSVEGISINECVERLTLGQVGLDIFRGYMDEFRFLIGSAAWISNFEVPTTAYTVSHQEGDMTSARWLKIPLLCGDGVERAINKLGVYPDISTPYLPGGGYNCEWVSVYDRISNYTSMVQNIAPNATIVGEDLISISFDDNTSLAYWTNLSSTVTTSYIFRTDFGGEAPHTFWSTVSNTFNSSDSYYNYDSGFLKMRLAADESGGLVFTTATVYGDCICELKYNDLSDIYSSGLTYTLLINTEDGTSYSFTRTQSGTSESFKVYKNGAVVATSIYTTLNTGIKFEREGSSLRIYTTSVTGFDLKYTFTDQGELGGGDIYFSFIVTKVSNESAITFNLYSFDVYGGSELSTDVEWQLVPSGYTTYALGCTSTVPIQDGPILRHPYIENGSQVQYIEFYYYNSGKGGGGIAFIDSNSIEILGIATINSGWLIHSAAGWEVVEYSPASGAIGWYRVKSSFDWGSGVVVIEWEDVNNSSVQTFIKSLIMSTDVEELQIKGTFGLSWGPDVLDVKFDNITISPVFLYLNTSLPSNCISGDVELQGYENCWGFPASITEPTLTLDLGKIYSVDKFVMYSRPEDSDYDHIVSDFDIYGATSLSGIFDLLVSESGFTESVNIVGNNIYELEAPVYIQYVKLIIKAYSKPATATSVYVATRDGGGEYLTLDGGFVREFQVWSSAGPAPLNSEEHPVVCMDLKDQFNITSHVIVSPNRINNECVFWNNSDEFYQFSSDITDDPRKVAFSDVGSASFPFSYENTFMKTDGEVGTYLIDSAVFLPSGNYSVQWETYNTIEKGILQLLVFGVETQILSSTSVSSGWAVQFNEFKLYSSDYYSVQIKCDSETYGDAWGVRNIYFKSSDYTSKWVALRRNTATNFVWNSGEYDAAIDNAVGVDFLQYLKLYADGQHRPTEYWWFWETGISTLENESINVKAGKRALKVCYPASDVVDYLRFLEGDCFGLDKNFSIKDSLSFWFYIEDIGKLYLDEGGFIFGSVDGYEVSTDYYEDGINPSSSAAFYVWKFKDLTLSTGWNYVSLRFDKNYMTSPTPNTGGSLSKQLDFRNFVTSSFRMVFKGVGEAFYMLLDDLKIERNWYYDEVVFGDKGLCLTWEDYAEIPLSGLDTRCGTFEAWVKLYTSTGGLDCFNNAASRTLCTLVDANNVSITLSIQAGSWFEIGVGDTKNNYTRLCIDPTEVSVANAAKKIDDVIHVALAWSNDATNMDGGDTIRFYINGDLYLRGQVTWDVGDNKNVLLRLGGGNTYLANSDDADGSAIFSNVKLYNYCKNSFEINKQVPSDIDNVTPNDFVQISSDGEVFYSSRDEFLPIEYSAVQPGEKVHIYVRVDKSRVDELDKMTGSVNVVWKIPV